jgi:hypothetical protein
MERIQELVNQLNSSDLEECKQASGELIRIGIPALPTLIGLLDLWSRQMLEGTEVISKIADANKGNTDLLEFVPTLVRALPRRRSLESFPWSPALFCDSLDMSRREAIFNILEKIAQNLETLEDVRAFEQKLQEGFDRIKVGAKCFDNKALVATHTQISELRKKADQKKSKLFSEKDLLLDGLPKPPKDNLQTRLKTKGRLRTS